MESEKRRFTPLGLLFPSLLQMLFNLCSLPPSSMLNAYFLIITVWLHFIPILLPKDVKCALQRGNRRKKILFYQPRSGMVMRKCGFARGRRRRRLSKEGVFCFLVHGSFIIWCSMVTVTLFCYFLVFLLLFLNSIIFYLFLLILRIFVIARKKTFVFCFLGIVDTVFGNF